MPKSDTVMVCTCCHHWKITLVKINYGDRDAPHQLLRITHYGFLVKEVTSVQAVADVLATYDVDIANFTPEEAHASTARS